jgi:hypothetical protein
MRSPRPASDWPRQIDDSDDTLVFVRPSFFGAPIPPISADASLDALLCDRSSTVRAKRSPAEMTTAELAAGIASDATLRTTCAPAPMLPANDVEASRRSA